MNGHGKSHMVYETWEMGNIEMSDARKKFKTIMKETGKVEGNKVPGRER